MRKATNEEKIPDDALTQELILKEYFAARWRISPCEFDKMSKKEITAFLIIADEKNKISKNKQQMEQHKKNVNDLRRKK